mmetsp:Transcript_29392/g.64853  ORF Transcript_29392/g.64853 Transcript_29392/m.64853 type:complete len:127 (-) Transcript_29392:624-1004(-)
MVQTFIAPPNLQTLRVSWLSASHMCLFTSIGYLWIMAAGAVSAMMSLPFVAFDLADFFVAQVYGAEFIWEVFAYVVDLKSIASELGMVPSSPWMSLPLVSVALSWASVAVRCHRPRVLLGRTGPWR